MSGVGEEIGEGFRVTQDVTSVSETGVSQGPGLEYVPRGGQAKGSLSARHWGRVSAYLLGIRNV